MHDRKPLCSQNINAQMLVCHLYFFNVLFLNDILQFTRESKVVLGQ